MRAAFAAGVRDFGENRVQEAEPKIQSLSDLGRRGLRWHLVGHLQSNKARRAAALFDTVHSLDSLELAQRLARAAEEAGRVARALVQVDLAGEQTKFGLPEPSLMATLEALRGSAGIRVDGLMLLPPWSDEPERSRPYFRQAACPAGAGHGRGPRRRARAVDGHEPRLRGGDRRGRYDGQGRDRDLRRAGGRGLIPPAGRPRGAQERKEGADPC